MLYTRAVRVFLPTVALSIGLSAFAVNLLAQSSSVGTSSSVPTSSSSSSTDLSQPPPDQIPPFSSAPPGASSSAQPNNASAVPHSNTGDEQATSAAMGPAGPSTSMENSESLFDVMAALNTCGYNEGLAISDPVRQKVRDDIDQALVKSAAARTSRDRLCGFIHAHTMKDVSQNLAAYISLALFLTPPPDLTTNVATSDLPPDATPVVGLLPFLRDFYQAVNLHLIWALHRSEYDANREKVHAAVARMLVSMDMYLKEPPPLSSKHRFLVLLEPLIAPGEANARVYGGDYIVVASPVNGKIDMKPVKHTYLRFVLEPLIYARAPSIHKLTPVLELVQSSPLPFIYKSDVLTLVTECMIRAIEAHTMDTGIPAYKVPKHVKRNQLAAVGKAEAEYENRVSAVREQAVQHDMKQGFVLTQYFYDELKGFAQSSATLQQQVGIMIYGMNPSFEKHRVQNLVFASHSDQEVTEPVAPQVQKLDEAERKLAAGDTKGAAQLAQQALAEHTDDPGRAQFILARADIMNGKMDAAVKEFTEAAQTSHDPRTIAWSHIYLGRLDDLQGDRSEAIREYTAAMRSRDGKPDTKEAAEAGIKAPFAPPHAARDNNSGSEAPNAR